MKFEPIMRYILLALLDQPKADFPDIGKMLCDTSFRQSAVQYVTDTEVLAFWEKEFPRYTYTYILPVLNNV